jgi:hypothetical protein
MEVLLTMDILLCLDVALNMPGVMLTSLLFTFHSDYITFASIILVSQLHCKWQHWDNIISQLNDTNVFQEELAQETLILQMNFHSDDGLFIFLHCISEREVVEFKVVSDNMST